MKRKKIVLLILHFGNDDFYWKEKLDFVQLDFVQLTLLVCFARSLCSFDKKKEKNDLFLKKY